MVFCNLWIKLVSINNWYLTNMWCFLTSCDQNCPLILLDPRERRVPWNYHSQCICLSVFLCVCQSLFSVSVCLSVKLSWCLSVCQSILCVFLFLFLFIDVFIFLGGNLISQNALSKWDCSILKRELRYIEVKEDGRWIERFLFGCSQKRSWPIQL